MPTAAHAIISPVPDRTPIPVEVIFNPNWWNRNYCISFDKPFYFDKKQRIENDVLMRQALYERFGMGEANPQPRPIIGSEHVAGGFVVPALLGVSIGFSPAEAPWPSALNLGREEIMALKVPKLESTWPMDTLIAQMDELEKEFGRVVGDLNTSGILNTALELRGHQVFMDMMEDPELIEHLFTVVAETQASVAEYVRSRTGTNSLSTNRSIVNFDPATYLASNCAVQMISPALYEKSLLRFEIGLAQRMQPFGVHHCGNNLQKYANLYAKEGVIFCDVGWGSDVAKCSELLPDVFLNLRLNPVRMLQENREAIYDDTLKLLGASGRTSKVGVCCINMDYGTPDENVKAMFQASADWLSQN